MVTNGHVRRQPAKHSRRGRYSEVREAAKEFLADAFESLHAEKVLPRSQHEPWIHVGQHYGGHLIGDLPATTRLNAAVERTFPQRFVVGPKGGLQSDFADGYPYPLISGAVAQLTRHGAPYLAEAVESLEAIEALLEMLKADHEAVTSIRVVADLRTPAPFSAGPVKVIPVPGPGSGVLVERMIEDMVPEAGYAAQHAGGSLFGYDRALLVASSTERIGEQRPHEDLFSKAIDRNERHLDQFVVGVRLITCSTLPNLLSAAGSPTVVHRFPPRVEVPTGTFMPDVARAAEVRKKDWPGLRRLASLTDAASQRSSDQVPPFAFALSRFNRSYWPHLGWNDKLVDLAIALEAVFGEPTERDDLSLRLKSRAASLLWTDVDPAERLFADVAVAYDLRSKVVHGRGVKKAEIIKALDKVPAAIPNAMLGTRLDLLVDRFRDIVRRAILARLMLSTGPAPIWTFGGRNQIDQWLASDADRARLRTEWRGRVKALGLGSAAERASPPNYLGKP